MKSRSIIIFMFLTVSLFGCEIKEPTTCLTGSEKCENDPVGKGGSFYICGQNGTWNSEIRCNRGCATDFKRCSDHSDIPHCDEENAIRCSSQGNYDIAFKCNHQQWIPEICQSGSCTEGSGCMEPATTCSEEGTQCYDVDSIGSFELSCNNDNWLMNYCNQGLSCSGSRCTDESLIDCGGVNCTNAPGWENGTCEKDKCVPSACKTGYHFYNANSGDVICEENTRDHCGKDRTACQSNEICQKNEGRCIESTVVEDDCIPGKESCEMDRNSGHYFYTVCHDDKRWSTPIECKDGCDELNHCKGCIDGTTYCVDKPSVSFEFQCINNQWIPEVCQQGCNSERSHCEQTSTTCHNGDSSCMYIDALGVSVEYKCINNSWVTKYCPSGVICIDNHCDEPNACTIHEQILPECIVNSEGKAFYGLCGSELIRMNVRCGDNTSNSNTFVCSEKTGYCAECKPGESRCTTENSIAYIQSCSEDEYWVSQERCEYGCDSETITCNPKPECTPKDKRCTNEGIQTCSDDGTWNTTNKCDADSTCTEYIKTSTGKPDFICLASGKDCISEQQKCVTNTEKIGVISECDANGSWVKQDSCADGASCKSASECGTCKNDAIIDLPISALGGALGIQGKALIFCNEGESVEIASDAISSDELQEYIKSGGSRCLNSKETNIGYWVTYESGTYKLTSERCADSASCADKDHCGECLNDTTKCESLNPSVSCDDQSCISKLSKCESGQWVEKKKSPNSCKDDKQLAECADTSVTCVNGNDGIGTITGCVDGKLIENKCKSTSCSGVSCGDCLNGEVICKEHASSHAFAKQECVNGKYHVQEFCPNGCQDGHCVE